VSTVVKPIHALILALTATALGCHAQTPSQTPSQAPAQASAQSAAQSAADSAPPLSPELARRVEVLIRSRSSLPAEYEIHISGRTKSDVPGFDAISVTFTADGKTSRPATFLLSADGKTLAQFSKFDISKDPKELISAEGRPSRGGPATAPVLIVGFDDLECPYCARMHAQIFPALTERYGDRIHIVYKDFPLDQHPWAMRAAIDTNCVGAHSAAGYWNLVDYVHAHAGEIGGDAKSIAKANDTLDTLARDEGKRQNIDAAALDACIAKQDDTAIKASIKVGESLGVDSTPALYINGEKLEGAVPLEYLYRMIDSALVASGQTPPPPPAAPVQAPQTTPPATKPGN
jgi:protein-disulfide isomerase